MAADVTDESAATFESALLDSCGMDATGAAAICDDELEST